MENTKYSFQSDMPEKEVMNSNVPENIVAFNNFLTSLAGEYKEWENKNG